MSENKFTKKYFLQDLTLCNKFDKQILDDENKCKFSLKLRSTSNNNKSNKLENIGSRIDMRYLRRGCIDTHVNLTFDLLT